MRTVAILSLAASAFAATHVVEVGESGLHFEPQTVPADEGDTVIFKFYPQHDVAQAAFNAPCVGSNGGFYSGPFTGTDNGKKKFVYNVTSTSPIWFYCTTGKHCQQGMVGAINAPTSGNTIEAFAEAAKNTTTERPSAMSGGELEDDQQIASLTASGGGSASTNSPTASGSSAPSGSSTPSGTSASTTEASSSTPTGSSASPSSSGVADAISAPVTGVLAAVLGFAAWLL
ncbi:hypothetical protein EJ04DRAFT_525325 [Polyplosphaeria fusca]|uniref:Cupredoxin n=1 Tax=Polyplosphaeria fusca TaxID=682080 RepID=A0A9P4QWE6_9PLEO|nr:hypothetical protein EJ04DRAFT_525325 [Polyplosphaeria fusca]